MNNNVALKRDLLSLLGILVKMVLFLLYLERKRGRKCRTLMWAPNIFRLKSGL